MVNRRAQPVGFEAPGAPPQAAVPNALPASLDGRAASGLSAGASALESMADKLAAHLGAWGDEQAALEGKRAGAIAGADPNFRPTDSATVRGRAFDREGVRVYASNVTARFQSEAMDIFDQNRNDPAALTQKLGALAATYDQKHIFPEIRGDFAANQTSVISALRMKALTNFHDDEKDKNRAALITDMGRTEAARNRLLTVDPTSPEAEAAALRMRDDNIARIKASAAAGGLSETQAAKQIEDEQHGAWSAIIGARAGSLKTPEEIDAYRAKARADFGKGAFAGLREFDTLDAQMAAMSKQRKTQADQAFNELDRKVGDFLERQQKGFTPSTTEWMALEEQAQALGARGAQAMTEARAKLGLRQRIAALPVDQADELVRGLERDARTLPAAGQQEATAMRFFMSKGWTREQAAGIVGNLSAESNGLNVNALNPGDGRDGSDSIGIAQWNAERARGLKAFAAARGKAWNDFETQLAFVDHELRTTHAREGDLLRASRTVEEAAAAGISFEKPAGWTWANPQAGHNFSGRLSNSKRLMQSGVDASSAAVLSDARATIEARRQLQGTDPLLAGERDGLLRIAPVDFAAAPDALAPQLASRTAQADALSQAWGRPVPVLRPDDRERVKQITQAGGDKALDLIDGVIRGGGGKAAAILKEIGGDAPELAQAGLTLMATGDRAFARQVADALKARAVPGAKVPSPTSADVDEQMRKTLGFALNGLDVQERERTRAAAHAWAEQELLRRNIDPKDKRAADVIAEGVRRARGMTGGGTAAFGGIAQIKPAGNWMDTVAVQAPADVRADRFGAVLDAISDADLLGLPVPPVSGPGRLMSAADLRRATPIFGPGGYRWGRLDETTGFIEPVLGADGKPFVLPWAQLAPELRRRVPDAFKG